MGSILEPDPPTWRERDSRADSDRGNLMTDSPEAAPQRKPRDAEAVRKVHHRWLERRSVRLGAALDGVEQFMVTGTAGGAVTSLAIVAAIIGSGQRIALEFYIVLVVFLIGLLAAWIGRYLDVVLAVDIRRSSSVWIGLYCVRRATFWLSAMAVLVGAVLGLIELYGFTR